MNHVAQSLISLRRWTRAGSIVWPRAQFKCEYCDTRLVDDIGTYLWGTPYDHILPKSIYASLISEPATASWLRFTATEYRNIALACHFCNLFKKNFDAGQGIVLVEAHDISNEQRGQLIERVREFLADRGRMAWQSAREEYRQFRGIIDDLAPAKFDILITPESPPPPAP